MKKLKTYYMQQKSSFIELKWIFPLAIGSILTLFLVLLSSPDASYLLRYTSIPFGNSLFVENKLKPLQTPAPELDRIPRLAYFISGSNGDVIMLRRTLQGSRLVGLWFKYDRDFLFLISTQNLDNHLITNIALVKNSIQVTAIGDFFPIHRGYDVTQYKSAVGVTLCRQESQHFRGS